ncbi:MAG: zinc ribbon domain-containing protein [Firmicutes bacterium]|nr:zinc ribbon domain-containing protein [Bacillota bacterium]
MEVLDNKCPACGAKITFNPKNQLWDCEYCGSKFSLEEMQKHNNASSEEANKKDENKPTKKLDDLDVYRCKNCGAEVMADEQTTATFCVYCGSTTILKDKINDGIAPTKIIPFKKVKEDAVTAFKGLSKGRPLMPKLFNEPKNIEKLTGVYIPFWTYDLNVSGPISFNGVDVKHWSDYNYRYTKTDTYLSKRDATMDFERILVDGSSRFDDDLMDSLEPFNFSDLVEYNHAYLSGFLAEKYDVDKDKAKERADLRAMNTAVDTAKATVIHQTKTVATNGMQITKKADDYILLPVWMVNIKYNEKMYTFAMNGQTGELVGNIPLDIKKTIIYSIVIFIITTIIIFLILTFGVGGGV